MPKLGDIPSVVLASDLPEQFTGIVKRVTDTKTKEGGLAIEAIITIVEPKDLEMLRDGAKKTVHLAGMDTTIMYRIPKALTGKGMGDLLLKSMKDSIGSDDTNDLFGKTFVWQRIPLQMINPSLPASFTSNPRHYPVKLSTKK